MSDEDGKGGFLDRWSRRKRGEVADPLEVAPAAAPPAAREAETVEPPEDDEAVLDRLGFRHPDLLDGDELKRFVRAAVPQHLKRIALRRLWRSNPVLANLDGLNDYDTDFTGGSVAPGELKTLYTVGRGFWKGLPTAEDAADEPDPAPEVEVAADDPETAEEETALAAVPPAPDAEEMGDAPRGRTVAEVNPDKIGRMKFRFEG